MEPMPCLGLAYIASILEKNDIDVEVIDDFVLRLGITGILDVVKEKRYDIVGISCLTPSAPTVFSIAESIKKYNRSTLVVLGNIHASVFSEDILRNKYVDVVVHGEGEYSMLELVKAVGENRDLVNIKGISFKSNGQIINTNPREPLEDLDRLPYPAWHLFPAEKYGFLSFVDIKKPGLSISGSRGCPYRCLFCSIPDKNRKFRIRESSKIVDEIEHLITHFYVKQIGFIDPIFPASKRQALEFCNEMISRGLNNKISWLCESRVDTVDREILKAMKEAGCKKIIYGIESGVQELLNNVKKNFSLDEIRSTVRHTKEIGIYTTGLFMIGLPGETKEMTQRTIDFAKEIDVDFAKFAITVPLPGSQLYESLTKSGKLKRCDWENFITFNSSPKDSVFVPGGVEPGLLIKMQKKAHFQFYIRPKIIFRHLFIIRTIRIRDLFFGLIALLFPYTTHSK